MTASRPLCCILIPFCILDDIMRQCLTQLMASGQNIRICLVVDGTDCADAELRPFSSDGRVVVLRRDRRGGPGAARNMGVRWCREQGIDLVVLLDSDCVPGPDFIDGHLRLHERFTDAACIGCGIRGEGIGPWAAIDGVASWFTSIPELPARRVGSVYHIPTTNMSFKLSRLPMQGDLFNEKLRTGEDIMFLRQLAAKRIKMLYEPYPVVLHHDRQRFAEMIIHQFRWALHTYSVRSPNSVSPVLRLFYSLVQAPLVPFTAMAMTALTLWPWIRVSLKYALFFPAIFILALIKSAGIIAGTLAPGLALRPADAAEHGA